MLADEFGMGRDTIIKRIRQSGIKPDGERDKNDVYHLRNIVPVLFCIEDSGVRPGSATDQLALARAKDAGIATAIRELELAQRQGRLVSADAVRLEMANLVKGTTQMLDTLPDVLERDAGLPAKAVVKCQEVIAEERDRLAKLLED